MLIIKYRFPRPRPALPNLALEADRRNPREESYLSPGLESKESIVTPKKFLMHKAQQFTSPQIALVPFSHLRKYEVDGLNLWAT